MPRVTVIIPTYNWSTVLPYSIGSVLRQTFADLELLVVGDGCTDDSEAVVAREAARDPRVRWINLPANTGQQAGPNNEGLRQARGELIAYLGHDDLWLPHHLALLVAAIDRDGAALAHGIVEMVSPDGTTEAAPRDLEAYRTGRWIPPTSLLHRRDAALAVGGWRSFREIGEDPEADLLRRLHAAGHRFAFVPRLTAIKLPAARRRDVYRTRPCHEQAVWSERIAREPDLEAVELGRLLVGVERTRAASSLRTRVAALARNLARRLGWRFLGYRRIYDRRRRIKGLEPIS